MVPTEEEEEVMDGGNKGEVGEELEKEKEKGGRGEEG